MEFNMGQSLGFILNRTAISSKNSFNKLIKSYGISPEQWSVIFRVVEKDGISQKELSGSTYKDQGNLTRMINKLLEKSYITKKVDTNDRRAVKLYATDKSKDLVEAIVPLSNIHNEQLTSDFSINEKEKLIELLNKVYENIKKD